MVIIGNFIREAGWKNKLIMADLKRRKAAEKRMAKWRRKHPEVWQIEEGDPVFVRSHELSDAYRKHIKTMFDLYHGPYLYRQEPQRKVIEVLDLVTKESKGPVSIDQCRL